MTAKRPRRTAERILDVTLAMFNRFGEPNVSTSQLCGELGISPGNLFYHHPTRDALVAKLFARYQLDLDQALTLSTADDDILSVQTERAPGAEPPWWQGADGSLAHLARLAEAIAGTAWTYRFLFRDLSDLVSRHRTLEEGLPPLLRRQALALDQALRALPWRDGCVDDGARAVWTGHLLASLTGSTGLDGALDPREHLRQSGPHAVDLAMARALGLLRPALAGPQAAWLAMRLGPSGPLGLGMDPWWLAPAAG